MGQCVWDCVWVGKWSAGVWEGQCVCRRHYVSKAVWRGSEGQGIVLAGCQLKGPLPHLWKPPVSGIQNLLFKKLLLG